LLWAASIDGRLSSLVACHYTDLHQFNFFVYLANKLSLSHQKAVITFVYSAITTHALLSSTVDSSGATTCCWLAIIDHVTGCGTVRLSLRVREGFHILYSPA